MSRVIAVWLPTWPTDRLRQATDAPLVTRRHDGHRMVIGAANQAAQALGLHAGMPLAHAQALVPNLAISEADPAGDQAALADLAAWCLRYSPRTAAAPPDGIWIDATGCAHLHGGEAGLLADLRQRLSHAGLAARAAIADTPGAAHAVVRTSRGTPLTIVPEHGQAVALDPLPVATLRIPPETADGLRRLGLDRIGQLRTLPRAPLTRRFGPALLRRLDQALGDLDEPIAAALPPDTIQHRLAFIEPLLTAEAFTIAIAELLRDICLHLEETAQGVRRLDLVFERLDATTQTLTIGTARAVRADRHLARLLEEKLDTIDPGAGVEAMRLVATQTEPLTYTQRSTESADDADLGALIDRLENRFGAAKILRWEPVESDVPERSVRPIPALAKPRPWKPTGEAGQEFAAPSQRRRLAPPGVDFRAPERSGLFGREHRSAENPRRMAGAVEFLPSLGPRPTRLLDPPHPVDAISLLPDQPPANFTWRRIRHRIRRADGPERIHGEWWRRDAETHAIRDYWAVEDEHGRRFWLFRRGDGSNPETGDLSWFLHGFF